MMKTKWLRALIVSALMGTVGAVLMYLEFPVPMLIPGFIKFDFSELPALITSFAFGPQYGILVCLVKNLLHLFGSNSLGVGELSNFILGAVFVGTAGLIYHFHKTRKGALLGCVIGALLMALISLLSNYYLVYPFYGMAFGMSTEMIVGAYQAIFPGVSTLWQCLLLFNVPFTLMKGVLDAVICFLIYKKIRPILRGRV